MMPNEAEFWTFGDLPRIMGGPVSLASRVRLCAAGR